MRLAGIAALIAVTGCQVPTLHRHQFEPQSFPAAAQGSGQYLKAHLKSGDLVVWSEWRTSSDNRAVVGKGERFDRNRTLVSQAEMEIPLDSVALFETNVVANHGAVAGMTVISVMSGVLSAICLTNPKACFGSCPTFYLHEGSDAVISAEGFSASIAPSLEASDVDALYRARPTSSRMVLWMTNEALETHVVRWARVMAVQRPTGGRVFATQSGDFWAAGEATAPTRCNGTDGDCLDKIRALDDVERFSLTDSTDLAAREIIELEFPPVAGDTLGLVIGSRQTLVSTYVLYQTLARFGGEASAMLAELERDGRARSGASSLGRALGAIEVQALDARGRWETLGQTSETGPLATDLRVVVLKRRPADTRRMRLRLTKGLWRVDYVGLAPLSNRAQPVTFDPVRVLRGSVEDTSALERLRDTSRALVTLPGDAYRLEYELPPDFDRYELFLQSRGYYLEWMRTEWLAEQDVSRAVAMLRNPARALRELAPAFKKQEADLEAIFWNSRYVRH